MIYLKKLRYFTRFHLQLIVALMLMVANLQAQTPDEPLLKPLDGDTAQDPPVIEQFFKDLTDKTIALKTQDISDYKLLYFVSEEASATADNIIKLGIPHVDTWEAVLQHHTETPLQLLMVDVSVLDEVDLAALQALYHRGTAIVGIDILIEDMITLTGDQCTMNPKGVLRYDPTTTSFFNLAVFSVIIEDESELPLVVEKELKSCSNAFHPNLKGGYYHLGFGAEGPLVIDEDYERLIYWLKEGAASFEILKLHHSENANYAALRSGRDGQ